MTVDYVIKNCKIVTPEGVVSAGVGIKDGVISALASDANLPQADRVIDARARYLIPGIIDSHVHLGLHLPFEKDCPTETSSAAIGGITTVGRFWRTMGSYEDIFPQERKITDTSSLVDMFYHFAVMKREHADRIPFYAKEYGITSFKFYGKYGIELISHRDTVPQDIVAETDDGLLYKGFANIGKLGWRAVACVHAENYEVIHWYKDEVMASGRKDLAAWTDARPAFTEEEYMLKAIYLANVAKCTLYNLHLSIGAGVDLVAKSFQEGKRVFAETCPHYLTLTKDDEHLGIYGKITPPLRSKEDQERLWKGLREGAVKTVSSDHVIIPKTNDLWTSWPGAPGMETLLPILLSEGINKGRLSLTRLVEVTSRNAARIFGLFPKKGSIQVGADADLCLIDLDLEKTISPETLHSSATWTPFMGMKFKGWPVMTMLRGEITAQDGESMMKPGRGKYLARSLQGDAAI